MLEFATYLCVRSVWSDHCGRRIVTSEGVAVASCVLFWGLSGAIPYISSSKTFLQICILLKNLKVAGSLCLCKDQRHLSHGS